MNWGLRRKRKIRIFGKGSYNGFNLESFKQTEQLKKEIEELRNSYGLTNKHTVLGYVGRLTKDKGIEELLESFLQLHEKNSEMRLLVVGEFETGDPVSSQTYEEINNNPHIIYINYQKNPIPFYFLMDVFVFLTKREGFGNVSLEASLAGVPVLAADVTGAKDTVIPGETGLLVNPTDIKDITEKIAYLVANPELRKQLGANGKKWGEEHFGNEQIWGEMDSFYQQLLIQKAAAFEMN
ncbi:glycosyltransferase family 4 protein [Planococcus glaciei]|nr:glycosyltransferase [Planococcus glaciei]QDY44729.1 glycosyltransferase family 4 protein [Planococcus glaciei]